MSERHTGDVNTESEALLDVRLAREEVEQGFYESRWDGATPNQRAFMVAMADDHDDRSAIADAVVRLNRQRASDFSLNRRDLIRSGHIYSPERGFVAFTVPGMADYILRHADL
jgi:hypothetical protein